MTRSHVFRAMSFVVLAAVLGAVPSALANSRIMFGEGNDQFDFEGRLSLPAGLTLDPTAQTFVIQLTALDGTVIFRTSIDGGTIRRRGNGYFVFRNGRARAAGGIGKVTFQQVRNSYRTRVRAYGDLSAAQVDMVTEVFVGPQEWSTIGHWEQLTGGWRLRT